MGMVTVEEKKVFLKNAGIEENFINDSNLDFYWPNNEISLKLVDKLNNYEISTQNLNYHPLIALINYILKQRQPYNLKDKNIQTLEKIRTIALEKLKNIEPKSLENNSSSSDSKTTVLESETDTKTDTKTNQKLIRYLDKIAENLTKESAFVIDKEVNFNNKNFKLIAKIQDFELPFGLFTMRGDAFFLVSHFSSFVYKNLEKYSSLCLEYGKVNTTSSDIQQIFNAKVPCNICFAIGIVNSLNQESKVIIQTRNPFDFQLDLSWYLVPVVYNLEEEKLYYYKKPSSFWEKFKGEIAWKKLREVIENTLNPFLEYN